MLDKNKKFRVIEEGVMNQGEMGMTKGGKFCYDKYGPCEDISYEINPCFSYTDPCDLYGKPCPNVEVYYFCPGKTGYLNCMKGMYQGH